MGNHPRRSVDDTPLIKRLGWMAAIWLASVSVLGVIAMAIRWWLAV